jgi:thioredoxin reductase
MADHVAGYEVHYDRVRREGIPVFLRHRLLAAEGDGEVESVVVENLENGGMKRFEADSLCLALGMAPLFELAAMRGCRMVYEEELGGFLPWHDEDMRTDRQGVYVAGDASGVEEASIAMEEGRMAGLSAAEDLQTLTKRQAARRKVEVRRRLDGLRGGIYGENKLEAKRCVYCR